MEAGDVGIVTCCTSLREEEGREELSMDTLEEMECRYNHVLAAFHHDCGKHGVHVNIDTLAEAINTPNPPAASPSLRPEVTQWRESGTFTKHAGHVAAAALAVALDLTLGMVHTLDAVSGFEGSTELPNILFRNMVHAVSASIGERCSWMRPDRFEDICSNMFSFIPAQVVLCTYTAGQTPFCASAVERMRSSLVVFNSTAEVKAGGHSFKRSDAYRFGKTLIIQHVIDKRAAVSVDKDLLEMFINMGVHDTGMETIPVTGC